MKNLSLILFLIIIHGCISKNASLDSNLINIDLKTISIQGDVDEFVPNDKIIESIQLVPLETKEGCLIKDAFKVLIKGRYVVIQNYRNNILVFDIDGSFIRKIGNIGRGPREYLGVYDFDLDNNLNVHICDGYKILLYTIYGEFIKSIPIDIKISNFPLRPEQIIVNQDGGYYFWKTFQDLGRKERDQFLLYKINLDHEKILSNHLPLKRRELNNPSRFHQFDGYYNIDPPYGLDTIYAADEYGVFPNYFIDFGNRRLPKPIPEWEEFSKYVESMSDANYVTRIYRFIETNEWIFFRFIYRKYYHNVFYSKILEEAFVTQPKRDDPPHKSLIMNINGEWNGKLFSLIEPSYLLEKLELMENSQWSNSLKEAEMELKDQISKLRINDNPVLLICEMKKLEK